MEFFIKNVISGHKFTFCPAYYIFTMLLQIFKENKIPYWKNPGFRAPIQSLPKNFP